MSAESAPRPATRTSRSPRRPQDPGRAINFFAANVAASASLYSCPIHEHCAGPCTGENRAFRPVLGRPVDFHVKVEGKPRDVDRPPHDVRWLDAQVEQFTPHRYTPIDSEAGQIRLLRVKPAVYREDVLECELLVCSLKDAPPFEALSYHWGPPIFDRRMLCNDELVYIARSLHDSLKRYRQDFSQEKQEYLWVDALCINQADKLELTEQVIRMREIYTAARWVRIMLSSQLVDQWFPGYSLLRMLLMADELGIKEALEQEAGPNQSSEATLKARQTIVQRYGLPALDHPSWSSYTQLFRSSWWTRTWTLQELVLAHKPKLCVGQFIFTWDELVRATQVFTRLRSDIWHYHDGTSPLVGQLNYVKMLNLIAWNSRPRSFAAPLYLLISSKDFEVSHPSDKIIAVLGMLNEQPVGSIQPFKPDYTVSAEVLYHRFSIHLVDIGLGQPLMNFAGKHRRKSLPDGMVPSWVVDWTALNRLEAVAFFATVRPEPFSATGRSPFKGRLAAPGPTYDPDILIVEARKFSTIRCLTDSFSAYETTSDREADKRNDALKLQTFICNALMLLSDGDSDAIAKSYHDPEDAFARTLLLDDTYQGRNAVAESVPIEDPAQTLLLAMDHLQDVAETSTPLVQPTGLLITTFVVQVATVCRRRKFAILEGGRMALVPEGAAVGDEIWLIHGAAIPFVLRKSQLVIPNKDVVLRELEGDAYVHGIMEGEAMTEEWPSEELWIC